MDPISGLISGGLSLVGGLLGQSKTDERQASAQAFNAQQAQAQMAFQERMSSSAWQRGVEDMKAAGINPILAYQKGPASSPTGSMASTSYTPAQDVITPAVSSAMQGMQLRQTIDNMKATNANLVQQNANMKAQEIQIGSQTANITADTAIKLEALQQYQREAAKASTSEKFYQSLPGQYIRVLGDILGELNPLMRGPRVSVMPRTNNTSIYQNQ